MKRILTLAALGALAWAAVESGAWDYCSGFAEGSQGILVEGGSAAHFRGHHAGYAVFEAQVAHEAHRLGIAYIKPWGGR